MEISETDGSSEKTQNLIPRAFEIGLGGNVGKDVGSDGDDGTTRVVINESSTVEVYEEDENENDTNTKCQGAEKEAKVQVNDVIGTGTPPEMTPQPEPKQNDDSLIKEKPMCEDNHMRNDFNFSSHAIRIHDVCQYHKGEIDQVGVEQGKVQHNVVWQSNSDVSERMSGKDLANEDNHVRDDHDATSHAIGIHDGSQHAKGEADLIGSDNASLLKQRQEWQQIEDEVQQVCS